MIFNRTISGKLLGLPNAQLSHIKWSWLATLVLRMQKGARECHFTIIIRVKISMKVLFFLKLLER